MTLRCEIEVGGASGAPSGVVRVTPTLKGPRPTDVWAAMMHVYATYGLREPTVYVAMLEPTEMVLVPRLEVMLMV